MVKGRILSDEEYKALLSEKRDNELLSLMKEIRSFLAKPIDNSSSNTIEKLIGELSEKLSKPTPINVSTPDVNVQVSTKEFVSSVDKLGVDLLKELTKFNNRPLATRFEIENDHGNLRIINVQYTTADKLIYKS